MFKKSNIDAILSVFITLTLMVVALVGWERFNGRSDLSTDPIWREARSAGREETSVFEKLLKPVYSKPVRLTIDALETTLKEKNSGLKPGNPSFLVGESHILITAKVNPVRIESDGSLETPKNWNEAGWYENGAMPGQTGNVLINAHYDDSLGRPAAFWQLKNIKIGDKVTLENEFGKVYTYEVTEFFYIDIRDPERLKIFNDIEGKSTVTLITCGGVWLPGESTYNKRLVVKGELSPEVGR